jgi:glycosyltransferase involved in cell wall biosynthesis
MKKIVLIDSSYPINNRNVKIINSLEGFEKNIIAWNRDNREYEPMGNCIEYLFKSNAPYGHHYMKLFKLIFYLFFINKIIKQIKPDIIIASHWDMLFIAALIKPRKCNLIYENLDMPTADSKISLMIQRKIEKFSLGNTDAIIFASRFFSSDYQFFKKKTYILENKPSRSILDNRPAQYFHATNKIKISFIGNLRYFDIMCNLINAVEGLPIDILFFGDGPDYMRLLSFANNKNYVYFFGKYKYENIKCIYDLSDLIWAVYPNRDYNVKFAISNKFFESLLFQKPAFYADSTCLGDFVKKNNIGFVIDPYSVECIKSVINEILSNTNKLAEITKNIKNYNSQNNQFWDDDIKSLKEIFDK